MESGQWKIKITESGGVGWATGGRGRRRRRRRETIEISATISVAFDWIV